MKQKCNILNTLPKKINGPYNMVRLEGSVDGIRKVIYIMFDQHIYHTECNTLPNLNIHNYLDQFFRNIPNIEKGTKFDFFLEIDPETVSYQTNVPARHVSAGEPYIQKLWKLFSQKIDYDPERNINRAPEDYPTTRFHLIDIRARYSYLQEITNLFFLQQFYFQKYSISQLEPLVRNLNFYPVLKELDTIMEIIIDPKKYKETLSKETLSKETLISPILGQSYLIRMAERLLVGYKHQSVKEKMNKIIEEDMIDYPNILKKEVNEFEKIRQTTENVYYLLNQFSILAFRIGGFAVKLMDIYMMRRFLDKDYIQNCICYVGGMHGNNYMSDLISTFGFKITHIDQIMDPKMDIDGLNELAKSGKWNELDSMIYSRNQCINLDNFPPNFM